MGVVDGTGELFWQIMQLFMNYYATVRGQTLDENNVPENCLIELTKAFLFNNLNPPVKDISFNYFELIPSLFS